MDRVKKALELALEAKKKAYAPYSKFQVGVALALKNSDKIYQGCNVENAVLGIGTCAEVNTFNQAIADLGKIEPEFCVIVGDPKNITPPCGVCRQMMTEFCADDFKIYLANDKEILKEVTLKEILPLRFSKENLID